MQKNEHGEQEAREREAAYRRGYSHAADETASLVLRLIEAGYEPQDIRQLLAVYDDHCIAPWKAGDLDNREPAPAFDLEQCLRILNSTTGYNWIK
jgi:DNA-binding transcriptional MerR regulator